jgi:hypothetical protein
MKKTLLLSLLAGAAMSNVALADDQGVSRDEVRAMVADMLADADTRSSLLQGGGVAGYDKGFVVRSPDGNYSLKINGLVQFRYVANYRNTEGDAGVFRDVDSSNDTTGDVVRGDDFNGAFQLRRVNIDFSGNLINSEFSCSRQPAARARSTAPARRTRCRGILPPPARASTRPTPGLSTTSVRGSRFVAVSTRSTS